MGESFKIVETDNFNGDYPDEKFVNLPRLSKDAANEIVTAINKHLSGASHPRFWKIVPENYELQPGFEA